MTPRKRSDRCCCTRRGQREGQRCRSTVSWKKNSSKFIVLNVFWVKIFFKCQISSLCEDFICEFIYILKKLQVVYCFFSIPWWHHRSWSTKVCLRIAAVVGEGVAVLAVDLAHVAAAGVGQENWGVVDVFGSARNGGRWLNHGRDWVFEYLILEHIELRLFIFYVLRIF